MSAHKGNPVKAVYDPNTGITKNFVATRPDIPVPDRKHDYHHGHLELNEQGQRGPVARGRPIMLVGGRRIL